MEKKDVQATIKKETQVANKKEIENIDSQISMKEKLYTIGITLILAITYEGFFTGKQWGISIPVFYIMFMGFFLWSVREKVRLKKTTGFIMIILIVGVVKAETLFF